ncbi:helix-turn-helix domain-containing protein [Streptomyces pathocidini]|uniref:Helix-turn-helix domain-containing protein n=1 Tax=Streptomyces pathocidini TaxID=1650571 RepID=A0ABW7UQP9_9ACTN|nr:helix-turn-helix transcriptional regulator [Streptomyces pathocidini]
MGLRVNPTYRQRRFGAELRSLRDRAGLSSGDAAALLGMRQSQLSNIEAGKTGLSAERVERLARAAGEKSDTYLKALVELGQDSGKGWWSGYREEMRPSYLDLAELEAAAARLNSYEHMYIPGLFQTFEYAMAVHRESFVPTPPEAQERLVEFRMERQKVLRGERPPQMHAIIHESALRVRYGGREVMRDQLLKLIEVSRFPNVTIQVYPLDFEGRVAFNSSFMMLEPPVRELGTVQLEQFGKSLYLGDREGITKYSDTFALLAELALPPIDPSAAPEARSAKDSLGLVQHILYPLL